MAGQDFAVTIEDEMVGFVVAKMHRGLEVDVKKVGDGSDEGDQSVPSTRTAAEAMIVRRGSRKPMEAGALLLIGQPWVVSGDRL
ncbi:hypothetical protein ACLOJK_024582 [Asimina triloba]